MRNSILSVLLACCAFYAKAQLPNSSFELTDTLGNIAGWDLNQGKLSKFSVINFGVVPFTAFDGNYFIMLESDTSTLPVKRALFEQQAAFTDTPGSIYLNYLYIPENTAQHAEIILFFTKWNGTQRDTVLYKTDTISVVANGNNVPIQWNTYSANLTGKYRSAILPDSAWVRLSNTDDAVPGKNIKLFADNIRFGRWAVGLAEQEKYQVSVFPNPASGQFTIKTNGKQQFDQILLTDITGKQFAVTDYTVDTGYEYTILVNTIPDGLYALTMLSNHHALHRQLIFIKH